MNVFALFSDEGAVFSTHTQRVHTGDPIRDNPRLLPSQAKKRFVEFIRAHHEGHIYKYRERLLHNYRKKKYMLTINLGDLANFDTKLKDLLQVCDQNFLRWFGSQNVVGFSNMPGWRFAGTTSKVPGTIGICGPRRVGEHRI